MKGVDVDLELHSSGEPMEGDSVHSRPWSLFLRLLPSPIRWVGVEFVCLIHWVDHRAGRALAGIGSSPAWLCVSVFGTAGVGLTIGLFISSIEGAGSGDPRTSLESGDAPNARAGHHSAPLRPHSTGHLGRIGLESQYHWATQDRSRIAHLFVPHKPATGLKDIQLDTRLVIPDTDHRRSNGRVDSRSLTHSKLLKKTPDIDVRLDLHRPQKAQQETRLAKLNVIDPALGVDDRGTSLLGRREKRVLVQATWEFGPDCQKYDYVSMPRHRPVPVPIPEPDVPLPPIRHERPDLSFVMERYRWAKPRGETLDSRLMSRSARSAFPSDFAQLQDERFTADDDRWTRSEGVHRHRQEVAIPYEGLQISERNSRIQQASEESDSALPALTEVSLRLELTAPASAPDGKLGQSRLFVANDGQDPIEQIEVQDFISELPTVVGAEPEGTIIPGRNDDPRVLHRELLGLAPGDGKEFVLRWIPERSHQLFHRVRVIAHAAVSTTTDVIIPEVDQPMHSIPPETPLELPSETISDAPPTAPQRTTQPAVPIPAAQERRSAVVCDVQYLERVSVGDEVEMEITVRNNGETALHNVEVVIDVPEQFSHSDGKRIVFVAGDIPLHGRKQTVLKFSAIATGDAVSQLQVVTDDRIDARGSTKIQVVEPARESTTPVPPLPEIIRSKPSRNLTPGNTTTGIQQPTMKCCCNQ